MPKSKMIESITRKSTVKQIDEFLKRKYDGFGFWEFSYSLMTVTLAYSTYGHRKKEKSRIEETIKKLEREKSTVIDNIKRFLIETDIWEVVKNAWKHSSKQGALPIVLHIGRQDNRLSIEFLGEA